MQTGSSMPCASRLRPGEAGQDLSEYGLLVGLIAIVVVVGVTLFGQNLLTFWNDFTGTLAAIF